VGADSDEPPIADRRPERRQKVLLAGVIAYDQGRHSFKCSIKDVTPGGARIKSSAPLPTLPPEVYLINLKTRLIHRARVTWTTEKEAGLELMASVDPEKRDNPDGPYLKRIMTAHIH
jgi:hypothetical protein